MRSIESDISALVALQDLKNTNFDLPQIQNQIFENKQPLNARHDPVIWALSSTLSSDIRSYEVISDSLRNGVRDAAVARSSAESILNSLEVIKEAAVTASGKKVDRKALAEIVTEQIEQIRSTLKAADKNGINLLKGAEPLEVLANLKSPSGGASAGFIEVDRQDLSIEDDSVVGDRLRGAGAISVDTPAIEPSDGAVVTIAAGKVPSSNEAGRSTGYTLRVHKVTVHHTLRAGQNQNDAVEALVTKFNALNNLNLRLEAHKVDDPLTEAARITVANDTLKRVRIRAVSGDQSTSGGLLGSIEKIDVTRRSRAETAIGIVDHLISVTQDAVDSFRHSEQKIENQDDFVTELRRIAQENVNGLIDTSLTESAARLKALKAQQFISGQSAAVANDKPAYLLSLFE